MHIVPFKAILPKMENIVQADEFFNSIKFDFSLKRNTHFEERQFPALYIYRIKAGDTIKTGLIACSDLSLNTGKNILPHEEIIIEKENRILDLCLERKAMIKPVLMIFQDDEVLISSLAKYIQDHKPKFNIHFKEDDEMHSIWEMSIHDSARIQALFNKELKKIYIADGHHRFSVARQLKTIDFNSNAYVENRVLSIFFPFSNVEVHSFDRVVDFDGIMEMEDFLSELGKYFILNPMSSAIRPEFPNDIIMLSDNANYRLSFRKNKAKDSPFAHLLSAEVIQKFILEGVLKIENLDKDIRVEYLPSVHDINEFNTKLAGFPNRVAFLLFPIPLNEIISAADQGKMLPPKSSWFTPRVKNAITSIKIFS